MKKILLLLVLMSILSCSVRKTTPRVGYDLADDVVLKFKDTDSIMVSEMRFGTVQRPTDLQKFLYNTYGKWTKTIPTNRSTDNLIWENIKIGTVDDVYFTVFAGGDEDKSELPPILGKPMYSMTLYCSAIVFTESNEDIFRSDSLHKVAVSSFLMNGAFGVSKEEGDFEKALASEASSN